LSFIVEAEDSVDYRHAVINGNALQRVGHGAAEIGRVACFTFQYDGQGDDRVRFFLRGQLADDDWNLERAGHSLERNRRAWRKRAQFFRGVIDEALHVLPVKLARHNCETAFYPSVAWTRRTNVRHGSGD